MAVAKATSGKIVQGIVKSKSATPQRKPVGALAKKMLSKKILTTRKIFDEEIKRTPTSKGFSAVSKITHGSPIEVIARTRSGFPASVFVDISTGLNIPRVVLFDAVGVSRSTMESRIKAKQSLSAGESDKVVRFAKVFERVVAVLEDEDQAKKWLLSEIRSIGGVKPLTLLDTEAGYELVMDTLGRIEQGIVA